MRNLAWLALLFLVPVAQAHARPAEPATLVAAAGGNGAQSFSFDFDEAIEEHATTASLEGADGGPRPTDLSIVGPRLTLTSAAPLENGTYRLRWRTLSALDGHETHGAWSITVSGTGVAASAEPSSATRPYVSTVGTALVFIGLALLAGALVFRLAILDEALADWADHWLGSLAFVGATLHLIGLGVVAFATAADAGQTMPGFVTQTSFGHGLLLRSVIGGLAMALLGVEDRLPRTFVKTLLGSFVGALFLLTATYSHAASGFGPAPIGILVGSVHVAAGLTWTGGIATYYFFMRSHPYEPKTYPAELALVSRRFNRFGIGAATTAAASGLALAIAVPGLVGSDGFGATYSRLVALKILLFAGVVGFGILNRFAYVVHYERQERIGTRREFQRSLLRESLTALAVVVLSAIIAGLAPPGGG